MSISDPNILLPRTKVARLMVALTAGALMISTALGQVADPEHDHDEKAEAHVDFVRLSPAEKQEFGIVVAEAGPAVIRKYLELPGEIHPNDNKLAHIVPRFAGIVTEVRAEVGDRVEPGQILVVIESDESLSPYDVKTLIGGTIIEKHITLGEAVSREHAAFVIADLSTVWADITIYQRDLSRIAVGQEIVISAGAELPPAQGKISYVTPIVDENTRTATARAVLSNANGDWRPGMFVTARILFETSEVAVAVPATALQIFEDRTVVFVEEGDGYEVRPVKLGEKGADMVDIVEGLEPGERYVVQGGFTLKAELQKESFTGGHAH